jgi:DNA-binding XRE family transcriptional regulator
MITGRQSTAARALLGWTLDDLAKESGLVRSTVHSFENENRLPSAGTVTAIATAFERAGIEFIGGGAIPRQVSSYVLNSYMELLDDVIRSMPTGGEVLKHCVDDRRSSKEVIDKVAQMRKMGIIERLTISDENNFITGDPKDYRQIPAGYFASSEVIIIYLNKVAFFVDGKALIIVSDALSKVFRDQFEYWWEEGKVINGT